MKVAALDLGTNSFLCLIAEVEGGEIRQVYSDEVQIVRLGQDVNRTRQFHPEALARARTCLMQFQKSIQAHRPEKVLAMATSAARDVSNSEALFQIGNDLDIPIEIIPGHLEAQITYSGAVSGFSRDEKVRAVIDIGGGSTEIIAGAQGKTLGGKSVDIGGVRMTELFFPQQPPSSGQMTEMKKHCREKLQSVLEVIRGFQVHELVAVAGTPTELAAAELGGFDPVKIDGFQMTQVTLQNWIQKFSTTNAQERSEKFGISKGRADIILAGTLILDMILEELKIPQVTVSTRGIRYGVALELAKRP